MENSITTVEGTAVETVQLPSVQMTKTSLIIPENTTFVEWEQIGHQLKSIDGAIQFWIGDWINFGERKYGEKYLEAIKETGYDYQTVRNIAYVAGKSNCTLEGTNAIKRHENLSYTHHREVAALDPEIANELLDEAEADGDSVAQLRGRIYNYKEEHDMLPQPAKKTEMAFSWFHEPSAVAMIDGMKAIHIGVRMLIRDRRDSDTSIYLLTMIKRLFVQILAEIDTIVGDANTIVPENIVDLFEEEGSND